MVPFFVLVIGSVIFPDIAFAAETEVGQVDTFGEYISQIWAWATQIIFGVSVVVLIFGGILYMTASGEEEKLDTARQVIQGALISTVLMLLSGVLFAVLSKPADAIDGVASLTDATFVLRNITNILLGAVGGISALMLVYNGIVYMISAGEYEKIDRAKRGLMFSLIGLALSLTAYLIVGWVIDIWI